jgi:nucleotide-binding universal stress UspA family protein
MTVAFLVKKSSSTPSLGRASAKLRSVLVPLDLTARSDRVLARLALLPLTDDARLTLLHVVPGGLSLRDQRSAARDAKKALAEYARDLTAALPREVRIEPVVKIGAVPKEVAACASSVKAELIVMGRSSGRALRDVFLGSTAERVIRRGQLPVLVVRLRARTAYRRPALALDLAQAAHAVVGLLVRVLPPPRPRVQVIYAHSAPYQGLVYPSLMQDDADERRDDLEAGYSQQLAQLLASSLAGAKVLPRDAPRWKLHLRFGSPRIVISKAVKKADTDLLVLGTHGYSGVAHMFLGSVAGDVLRNVACDVLVVPPRPPTTKK